MKFVTVQGDSCPRDFCPMTQLSKQTFVQGDFCPRKCLTVKSLLKLIFLFLYWDLPYKCVILWWKNSMSSYHFFKVTPWTKVSLDNSLLGQLCHWTKVPWTTVTLDNRPFFCMEAIASFIGKGKWLYKYYNM